MDTIDVVDEEVDEQDEIEFDEYCPFDRLQSIAKQLSKFLFMSWIWFK